MDSPFSSSSASFGRPPRPAITFGALLALSLVFPVAVLIGTIYHFIGKYLDLIVIFPMLAGLCVGGVLASLAKKQKVRSKPALVTLAILAGTVCFCSRWIADSLQTREEFINSYSAKLAGGNPAIEAKAQSLLRRTYTPLRFLPMYLKVAAKEGATITSTHDVGGSSHNSPITGTAFWGLALFDALLMCGAAAAIAAKQASAPFCASCDSWHGGELTVSRLDPLHADEAAKLAQARDFAGLGGLRGGKATEKANCDVLLSKCPGCQTGQVTVRRHVGNAIKTLWSGQVSPTETAKLQEVRAQWLQ